MGDFFSNVQGRPDDCGNRTSRRRIVFGQSNFATATGVPIGAIEKGGVLLRVNVFKNVAFSAGATVTLGNVANPGSGQTAVVDSFGTSASIAPQTAGGIVQAASSNGMIGAEMPADTVIYAYLGGTAATAGDITFVIEYAPAYNWSDLDGSQRT